MIHFINPTRSFAAVAPRYEEFLAANPQIDVFAHVGGDEEDKIGAVAIVRNVTR